MELFILSFIVFGLAAAGMAVGALSKGSELKGTCATLNAIVPAGYRCEICSAARHRCRNRDLHVGAQHR